MRTITIGIQSTSFSARKLLGILFFGLLALTSNAQTAKIDTFKKAIGIDATFINNFLPFDNTIGERGDYLLHYIKYKEGNRFTRQAFDIDIFGQFNDNETEADVNDARFNIDYKISSGKRKEVFKSGYLHYGTELLLNYILDQRTNTDNNDTSGESKNRRLDQTIEALFGPFLGLQYKISPRISIYTEAGFYLMGSYTVDKFKSDFDPDSNFKNTSVDINEIFDLPGSIILFYHF